MRRLRAFEDSESHSAFGLFVKSRTFVHVLPRVFDSNVYTAGCMTTTNMIKHDD